MLKKCREVVTNKWRELSSNEPEEYNSSIIFLLWHILKTRIIPFNETCHKVLHWKCGTNVQVKRHL